MKIKKGRSIGAAFYFGAGGLLFLPGDQDVIFEGHDLASAEEGLLDEGQCPVF